MVPDSILYLIYQASYFDDENRVMHFKDIKTRDLLRVKLDSVIGSDNSEKIESPYDGYAGGLKIKKEATAKITEYLQTNNIKPDLNDFYYYFRKKDIEFPDDSILTLYCVAVQNKNAIYPISQALEEKGITIHKENILVEINHDKSGKQADICDFEGGAVFRLTEDSFKSIFAEKLRDKEKF
jgi:hypothetical protein